MKRIIIHWTAGTYHTNQEDFKHYHYMITGEGLTVLGDFTPEDNINCKDGKYAAHTEMGNTGSIGFAFCGMKDFDKGDTHYPLKREQCEAGFKKIAELCRKYNIAVTPSTVLTHYEFDCNRGKPGRKIDIICLPYMNLTRNQIGDYIRERVKSYL